MLVRRRPGVAGPGATRSYSPSMLFRWMPVPGTITPEPEPVDDESDAALPSASTTETCVVPPAGACSGAPAAARRSARAPRAAPSARAAAAPARRGRGPPRSRSSRARVCSRITSTSAATASALPARRSAPAARAARARRRSGSRPTTAAGSRRTRAPRYAHAHRAPPDDAVLPRGRSSVSEPPPSRTVSTIACASSPR